ncbi:MAG: SNF2-related protein [Eubacteriales bacterium]|nr:SNF2-related protein [Eubacteriales bacterium]
MERPFSSADAKRLIESHAAILERLENIAARESQCRRDIRSAADALAAGEVLNVLREIPVDELNRDKQGIRVKLLRDHNYTNIADICHASAQELSDIQGISEDSANMIKQLANDLASNAKRAVKIKLSADDRNARASRLIKSVYLCRAGEKPVQACRALLREKTNIESAVHDLGPASNGIKWFLTSRQKKDRCMQAYTYLTSMMSGDYGQKCKDVILEIDRLSNTAGDAAWDDFSKNSISYFTLLEEIAPGLFGDEDTLYGLPEDLAHAIQEECIFPDGLLCTLRRYQEWGVRYILHQERVLLGDEMGLGKTIQAIAAMVSLKNTGAAHFMVICPASVVTNWCREIRKHSLLNAVKIHGAGRESALASWLRDGGVAVTTYETTGVIELDADFRFSMAIVDEAHYIKNPKARRTANTKAICSHADRLLFMTGTALENKVDEMIALIRILRPKLAAEIKPIAFMSAAPQFREKIAPVYFRRKREDVLTELPELIETSDWCTMSGEEESIYEEDVLNKRYADARRVSWNVEALQHSSKAQRLKEIIDDAEDDGRKVIVFSFFLDTMKKVGDFLGERCLPPINGSVPPNRRQEIIDAFEAAPAGSVLLAQIQSGGTGLNIQAASVVVICEPQFKPSTENQAISRAYRMGQARNVLVHRLLCDDTVDEKIMQVLEQKQAVFDAFADESAAARESLELDEKTFGNIIQEEIDRIQAKRDQAVEAV